MNDRSSPPVGWADVATKRDLDLAIETLWHRFEASIACLEARLQWRIVTWVTGLNIGLVGLAFAAAKLA
jgi:hypothetical protein